MSGAAARVEASPLILLCHFQHQKTVKPKDFTVFIFPSVSAERKQSDGSCSLDSEIDFTLMFCAGSGYTAGQNLASFGNETTQCSNVLVINGVYVIYAALADLSSRSSYSISSDHALLSSKINVYQNGISSSLEEGPN